MTDSRSTFAEQCEKVIVDVLGPFTERVERFMSQVEQWLENRSPIGISAGPGHVDHMRGEPLVSDLAPGMLTAELLTDSHPDP